MDLKWGMIFDFTMLVLLLLWVIQTVMSAEIIHVAGPMRGSFAVYCTSPPALYKRDIIQGPAMEGSFVFYGYLYTLNDS